MLGIFTCPNSADPTLNYSYIRAEAPVFREREMSSKPLAELAKA